MSLVETKDHSNSTKAVIILIAGIVLYLLAFSLWWQGQIDSRIVVAHNFVYMNDTVFHASKWVTDNGIPIILIVYIMILITWFRSNDPEIQRLGPFFLLVIITILIGGTSCSLLKDVFQRARPVAELGDQILLRSNSLTRSFPSGHTSESMSLALPWVIFAVSRSRWILASRLFIGIAALMVSYSRLMLLRHYPADILAGVGTALIVLFATHFLIRWLIKKFSLTGKRLLVVNRVVLVVLVGLLVRYLFA